MNRFRKWMIEALGGYTCPIGLEQVQFKAERPKIETCRSVLRIDPFRPVPSDVAEDMVTYRLWSDTVKDYVSVKVEDIPGGALYIAEIEVVMREKWEPCEEASLEG